MASWIARKGEAEGLLTWSRSSTAVERPARPLPTMATLSLGAPCSQVRLCGGVSEG
jgi:hypothetical protein